MFACQNLAFFVHLQAFFERRRAGLTKGFIMTPELTSGLRQEVMGSAEKVAFLLLSDFQESRARFWTSQHPRTGIQ
jgi:hypothetical protein